MAASSPASAAESEKINTDQDMETDDIMMNSGDSDRSGTKQHEHKEDAPPNNSEDSGEKEEDPFKKPALFAAPSLAVIRQRSGGPSKNKKTPVPAVTVDSAAAAAEPPSRGATTEPPPPHAPQSLEEASSEEPAANSDEKVTTSEEEANDGEEHPDKAVVGAVKKTQQEAKPRVSFPVRGPPTAAGFKAQLAHPPVPYTEPPWGGVAAEMPYALEILKNGTIVDTVPLSQKSYFVVGRLPVCDVPLEHPSISRYHAVIQYRGQSGEEECVGEERGFYLHDLGSTHGTVVNKNKIPPKTYIRIRVGHVVKFGGSTRLFILQGPEFDEEEESEHTVTQLRERATAQRANLEKRMMGEEGSDGDDDDSVDGEGSGDEKGQRKAASVESGCSWGMGEETVPEEDENEENPFATEFREDQEAAYLKDPKKALQGFYDREGEELEFEFEDQNHGTWLCRVKLPVDDALGRQLVAEVTHTGKKKDAAVQCSLEACRILEARGLLRQEAVSRKRKKKNWEDEDYYDSDDDTFLDRTGVVEKKRQERMKKAGKIEERPETYDSLVAKLAGVEKELTETQKKLNPGGRDSSSSSTEDTLDAFMSAVRSEAAMDAVERRKLHVHVADLRKEAQRLRKLVELTRPAQMPSLQPSGTADEQKPKKSLPLFGAMKGGSKFKLKTGTIGKLPPKRPDLPAELFNMKELPPGGEEEEEDDDEKEEEAEEKEEEEEAEEKERTTEDESRNGEGAADLDDGNPEASTSPESASLGQRRKRQTLHTPKAQSVKPTTDELLTEAMQVPDNGILKWSGLDPTVGGEATEPPKIKPSAKKYVKKKTIGPAARPPVSLSGQYPEDDPDYCVWVPPTDQSGDGRTHLNDKFGY